MKFSRNLGPRVFFRSLLNPDTEHVDHFHSGQGDRLDYALADTSIRVEHDHLQLDDYYLTMATVKLTPVNPKPAAIASAQSGLEQYAGPGHWNDPDMLEAGNGGMNDNEYRMHMAMWRLLAAPLLAGNDLTEMTPATLAILTNPEAIAVDQDALGIQGRRVLQVGPVEVWVKLLHDGSKAVGLFNREQGIIPVQISLKELGLGSHATVRDLWEHKDLPPVSEMLSADVGEHGVVFLKLH